MYRKITTNYKFSGSKRYKILAGYGMLVTFDPIKTPTCWLWFSSVQFKIVSVRSECSPTLPLKQFQCSSDLILTEKIFKHFLFPRLSSSGDRWCDVLGFVPTGSVSSSSTFQIFRDAHHLWWSLCPPVCVLCHFPLWKAVPSKSRTGWCETWKFFHAIWSAVIVGGYTLRWEIYSI